MCRSVLFYFSFFVALPLFSQESADDIYIYGVVIEPWSTDSIGGASVEVYVSDSLKQKTITIENGKYELWLDFERVYKILYSYEGRVSKSVQIDTRNVPLDQQEGGFGMNINMVLYKEVAGVDFSLLEEPIGKAAYQNADSALVWDYEYTKSMSDSLSKIFRTYEKSLDNDQ